jgi:hypothetical protein
MAGHSTATRCQEGSRCLPYAALKRSKQKAGIIFVLLPCQEALIDAIA